MEPQKTQVTCLVCSAKAVSLEIRDVNFKRTAVDWCINGHIVVVDPNAPQVTRFYWTMNDPKPIEK